MTIFLINLLGFILIWMIIKLIIFYANDYNNKCKVLTIVFSLSGFLFAIYLILFTVHFCVYNILKIKLPKSPKWM